MARCECVLVCNQSLSADIILVVDDVQVSDWRVGHLEAANRYEKDCKNVNYYDDFN